MGSGGVGGGGSTTGAAAGMNVSTASARAHAAQVEAFDRILSNHLLYCTVCDNNNGNCTVHNTTKLLAIEHLTRQHPVGVLRTSGDIELGAHHGDRRAQLVGRIGDEAAVRGRR